MFTFAPMEEKEQQRLIRRYNQYLKLEKGSSPNTIDAYMRDLDKFLRFIKDEGKDFMSIQLEDLHHFSALMMVCTADRNAKELLYVNSMLDDALLRFYQVSSDHPQLNVVVSPGIISFLKEYTAD